MLKRLAIAVVALAFVALPALAAPPVGKVAAIDGEQVQLTLQAEKPAWVKKNAAIRIKGGAGKIVAVDGATITVQTKKAADMQVGDDVTFTRAGMSGC